jgi:hypothetical protein
VGGLQFVRQAGGVGELGIDLAEIHLRAEVEPGELVDGEARALLGLGLAPGLVQLLAALLLQDPRELGFKAAVDLLLGQADAEEARRAIGADIGAQALRIALVEQHLLAAAAERDEQLDARDQREAFALAAVEHAEDLGRAGFARALEQGERVGIELAPRLVHRVEATTASLNSSLASRWMVSHEPSMQ